MDKKRLCLSLAVVSLAIIVVIGTLALGGLDRSHAASPSHVSAAQLALQPIQFKALNAPVVQDNVYYGADGNSAYAHNATTGTLLWRYRKIASVSSLIFLTVSGGSVFLDLYGFLNGSVSVVVALNASTGALRWTSSDFGYGNPWGSAYVANGILYYLRPGPYSYGSLYAISMNNGTILWGTAASTVFGDGQGMFYISVLSTVTEPYQSACAVNAITGAPLWCYQHAYIVGGGQGVIYATVHDWNNPSAAAVVALRASDGSLLWSYSEPTFVTFAGNSVYVLTYFPTTQSATLCALSASAGSSRWCDSGLQYTGPIEVLSGVVYVQGSSLQAYRASDGTLLWTEKNARLLFVDRGVTYLLDKPNSGNTMLIAHSDRSPAILWQRSLGTGNVNTRCLFPVNSVLYCASADGHVLYAFMAPNGSLLRKFDLKGAISWVGVTNGIVYATADGHVLYAFMAPNGNLLWKFDFKGTISWVGVTNGIVYATTTITINGQNILGNHAFNASTGTELWSFWGSIPPV